MNNQSRYFGSQFGIAQPNNNRMLWLIIGLAMTLVALIIGAVVIGVFILVVIAGNAEMTTSDTVSDSNNRTRISTTGAKNKSKREGSLVGSWNGTLRCDSGDQLPAVFKVSEQGNPIYEYQTKSGNREIELTSEGQSFRFVPTEGGVMSIVVDALSVSSDHISYSMNFSEERTSGGTLTQSRGRFVVEAEPLDSDLKVKLQVSSNSTLSQPGIVVPGDGTTEQCSGILKQ